MCNDHVVFFFIFLPFFELTEYLIISDHRLTRNNTICLCFCAIFFSTASLCRSYTLILNLYLVALVGIHSSALHFFPSLNMFNAFYDFFC